MENTEEVSLGVPRDVITSLPEGEQSTAAMDMQRSVEGIEARINEAIADAESEGEAAGRIADAIERMEAHLERYDEFVPELRAWGQSPIYAIAWRNLQAALLTQLHDIEWLTAHLDRERNYRLVEDGIRLSDREKD